MGEAGSLEPKTIRDTDFWDFLREKYPSLEDLWLIKGSIGHLMEFEKLPNLRGESTYSDETMFVDFPGCGSLVGKYGKRRSPAGVRCFQGAIAPYAWYQYYFNCGLEGYEKYKGKHGKWVNLSICFRARRLRDGAKAIQSSPDDSESDDSNCEEGSLDYSELEDSDFEQSYQDSELYDINSEESGSEDSEQNNSNFEETDPEGGEPENSHSKEPEGHWWMLEYHVETSHLD